MYIMQRTLDKKTAKLTQLQGSCPRAKSVASFYFFNSSFIRINRLACCGSLGILPLLNDAKTWSDQPQKSPEHLFGKTATRCRVFRYNVQKSGDSDLFRGSGGTARFLKGLTLTA